MKWISLCKLVWFVASRKGGLQGTTSRDKADVPSRAKKKVSWNRKHYWWLTMLIRHTAFVVDFGFSKDQSRLKNHAKELQAMRTSCCVLLLGGF
jgi:hypothetical protein